MVVVKVISDGSSPPSRALVAQVARLERQLIHDADNIAELYNRIAWLEHPWWQRAFRRAPWLGPKRRRRGKRA